ATPGAVFDSQELVSPRQACRSAGHREGRRRNLAALATLGLEGVFSPWVMGTGKAARHGERGRDLAAGSGLGVGKYRFSEADVDLFGGSEPAAGKGDPRLRRSRVRGEGAPGVGRGGRGWGRGPGRPCGWLGGCAGGRVGGG